MTHHRIEMAFDWNAYPIAMLGVVNLYPLHQGLCQVDTDGAVAVPAWYTKFQGGDTIEFFFFDETGDGALGRTLSNFQAFFRRPDDPDKDSDPFVDLTGTVDDTVIRKGSGNSFVFGKDLPKWFAADPDKQVEPRSYVLRAPDDGHPPLRHMMMVRVAVTQGSVRRTYGFDPEMVVGGDEGDPSGGGA